MRARVNILVTAVILTGLSVLGSTAFRPGHAWGWFALCAASALLSSGLKVKRPSGSGSMSLNYPFIFLAMLRLSPFQVCLVAALSVLVQSRVKKLTGLAIAQCAFNVCNSIISTACACAFFNELDRLGLPQAPVLALAACVYFFCNTIPVAMVIGWSQGAPVLPLWKSEFRWFLPFYVVGAVTAAIADAVSRHYGWATGLLVVPIVYTLFRAYNAQVSQWEERRRHLEETEALHLRTIEGLAMAIEAKDHNTHEHLFRVRDYVTDIATTMGLDQSVIKALQIAAFLHDIGKLAVPEHIINKPGKLSTDEFEKMKIHPSVGADILERVRFPYPVVPIVRSHHEQWDGSGYPDGLKGEEIPLGARILSVVDCFDALASDRPYRKAMPLEKAMAVVKASAGKQFDPAIVDVLERRYQAMENSLQERATFVALDTTLVVQRGDGPGAGLEQIRQTDALEEASTTQEAASLSGSLAMIAAASHEAHALYEMSRSMGTSLSVSETAWVMESRLRALVPFECCAVYLKGVDSVTRCYVTEGFESRLEDAPIPLGEGISGWVAQSGRMIVNGNATVEPTYRTQSTAPELHAALSAPLCDLQGEIVGVITLYASQADSFSREHGRILQATETKFSLSLQNALKYQHAETSASTDALTGLPNARTLFRILEGELNRCRRSGLSLVLVLFDLDRFLQGSDAQGRETGDRVIAEIGQQLRTRCRNYDTVARVGSDEFALLFPDLADGAASFEPEWVHETVKSVFRAEGIEPVPVVSIGVAISAKDGDTPEELLAAASRRMHLQKRAALQARSAPVAVAA